MPSLISFGVINVSTPQQNAGVFIGQINITGFDTHQKLNMGHGPLYGVLDISTNQYNYTFDGFEWFDTLIFDQDNKSQIASNV